MTQSNMSIPRATHSTRSTRRADTHQITGLVRRQTAAPSSRPCLVHLVGGLADAEAANRVALEPDRDGSFGAAAHEGPAKSRPERCRTGPGRRWSTATPAAPPSRIADHPGPAARRPSRGQLDRGAQHRLGRRQVPDIRRAPSQCRTRAAPGYRPPFPESANRTRRRGGSGTRHRLPRFAGARPG